MNLRLPHAMPGALPVPRWDFSRATRATSNNYFQMMIEDEIVMIGGAGANFLLYVMRVGETPPDPLSMIPVSGYVVQPVRALEQIYIVDQDSPNGVYIVPMEKA